MLFKVVVSFWVGEGCQTVNKLNIKFSERSADFAQCPQHAGEVYWGKLGFSLLLALPSPLGLCLS